ncbi:hypothetical protein BGZ83_001233 [Gryganskiella cystojenkinii]|nr:hypothetical protein BGZ83_001233 [Gryganskiella cystojenkinii]
MIEAKTIVRQKVNELRKLRTLHPYEEQGEWNCNVAAVNHYAHSKESVGWHADKLTYLGPRPTIGSLTLGATRFFRIRKVVPDAKNPDTASQMISIALPHNSLLIMWPPMQEEWKHEVPTVPTVTPHPISGTARINITYRLRRKGFSPEETPVCQCGVAMVLRCVFKNKANYGKYFYMCYAAGSQEGRTCGEFHWVDMEQKLGLLPAPSSSSSSLPDQQSEQGGSVNKIDTGPSTEIPMTSLQAVERTLSGLNLLGPDGWPAWTQVLQKAHKTNYGRSEDPIYLHLASKTRLGAVTLLAVQFQDFLQEDGRYLLFLMSMTDQNLLSTVQSNQTGQLAWQMPKSREYFHLTGKFYICSSPRQVTRYTPPVLNATPGNADAAQRQLSNQFWESKRVEQWKKLPAKTRASFTWPVTGSTPRAPAAAFQCLAMEDLTDAVTPRTGGNNRDSLMSQDGASNASVSSPSSPVSSIASFRSRWNTGASTTNSAAEQETPLSPTTGPKSPTVGIRNDNPAKILHDIALDNFCLLVFKPLDIVHFESSPLPPKRTIYTTDAAGQWAVSEANP